MFDTGDLFQGNTPGHERSVLLEALKYAKTRYDRFVVPCCGQFAGVQVAVEAGWKPEQCEASDVSLFSSVVGLYLSGQPLDDLEIVVDGDLTCLNLSDPAEVLFALKLATARVRAKNYYTKLTVRELERNVGKHIANIRKTLEALNATIGGMQYQARDLFEHMADTLDDPKAVVFCNPPAYHKGYDKMFDTGGAVQFSEVPFEDFDAKKGGYDRVRMEMAGKPALGLRFMYQTLAEDEDAEVICAECTGGTTQRSGWEYILTNRPEEVRPHTGQRVFVKKRKDVAPVAAPVLPSDYEITTDSAVTFRTTQECHAMYYRDLFAHRLGASTSEQHYLMMVDGHVAGVVGLHFFSANHYIALDDGKVYLEETYGFTSPSKRHKRLNRLLMMLICTGAFRDRVAPDEKLKHTAGLATTCLCRYPELKINRGIMKLVSREPFGAMFKLRYRALWKPDTFQQVLEKWLTKHGQVQLT